MPQVVPPHNAIQVQAAIDIAAPPKHVAAVYRDVDNWDQIFPASIGRAQVTETGDDWKEIEVTHKNEGRVPNTLIFFSDAEIWLEESKKTYDASLLNRFEPAANGGTHYIITAYIDLKGIYKAFRPFIRGYVRWQARKQLRRYVLHPLKTAAEKEKP